MESLTGYVNRAIPHAECKSISGMHSTFCKHRTLAQFKTRKNPVARLPLKSGQTLRLEEMIMNRKAPKPVHVDGTVKREECALKEGKVAA